VSTLGKIELQGRDVAELLNRIYSNRFDNLQVGRCRYGLMLREDGFVRDDGTTSRLDATHYLMTTTTANAVAVMQLVERLLQVDWPDLDVYATSVTENWAAAAISGPKSRALVGALVDIDVSNDAFPFLAVVSCNVRTSEGVVPARLFRMSYSGELAYEIHVPARHGRAMWEAAIAAGGAFGVMPYGTEAMGTLRIEKGHVVIGAEIDGRTTAADLGMEKLVNAGKWCLGKPLVSRAALNASDRWQLVGVTALAGAHIPRGGKIVADPGRAPPNPMLGHITSWCFSPHVDAWIGLASSPADARGMARRWRYRRSPMRRAGEDRSASVVDAGWERLCCTAPLGGGAGVNDEAAHARRRSADARMERARRWRRPAIHGSRESSVRPRAAPATEHEFAQRRRGAALDGADVMDVHRESRSLSPRVRRHPARTE
jgi:glycine cleavage system aminomethyltransferase T